MTSPVEGAYVVKDASVTINGTQYANQLGRFRLIPDTPTQTYRTAVPNGAVVDVDSPVWTFDIAGLQVNTANGLAAALRAMDPGEEVDVVLIPHNRDTQQSATFTIVATPVEFGGETGSFATFEKVFGVKGQPVFATVDLTP